ncbi:NapC/NirT family cytochrome c [Thiocystis violascens]|uniref:Cytochrome c-type protein n=1 Tax=Thiocystis violascens (strain ATCC 17096 / DSM 198 / 6111) TaxID=765911 RepID=I3YH12_THIV6|nr:nitrate/TMAO reductase, membrane-bound tetraheme cytochrome c subunit [Thiocystis violascens DSM 198]
MEFRETVKEPKRVPRRFSLLALVLVFLAGIAFVGTANYAITATNTLEFCTSCHTMQTNYQEYQETLHFKNPSGVQATCADCHVPKEIGPKLITKIVAAKDVYHEIMGTIDTPEKFEARRWHMANNVWKKMKASDSRECRTCHDFANMDLSEQSRSARSRHAAAEDKGETCIDCHKGVVHHEPDEPDGSDHAETAQATVDPS